MSKYIMDRLRNTNDEEKKQFVCEIEKTKAKLPHLFCFTWALMNTLSKNIVDSQLER